jgi:signal transduction histidine kinase
VASVLYRVAHEAVTNALRHGSPHRVDVRLDVEPGVVTLNVADDGRGFDVAEAEARRPGMGLFTMRERVALLDGQFEVRTRPGGGTCIRATIPLPATKGRTPDTAATAFMDTVSPR